MTPEITIRTFSDDQYVLDKVFYSNYYRIKQFAEDKVVVDVGAHAGYFSALCALRNAAKVYAYEPFCDNYRMLVKNSEHFREKVFPSKMGVYTENRFANFAFPKWEENFLFLADIKFHSTEEHKEACYIIKLDEVLDSVDEPEVELLKIHIGYAEADILLSSERIDKCKFVCGETIADEIKLGKLVDYMREKGFQDSFVAPSKEKENQHLFLFAKYKCEDLFNMMDTSGPDELPQVKTQAGTEFEAQGA